MKLIQFKYLMALLFILSLNSCEDVIVLELESTDQRTVIEADIDATNGICTVHLSKSGDFYETNNFEKITGANITLSVSSGKHYSLIENSAGYYSIDCIEINPGETVGINILLQDNKSYFSSAIVPYPVTLKGLKFDKTSGGFGPGSGGNKDGYNLIVMWDDPAELINYNRIKIYTNREFQSDIYALFSDKLRNGNSIGMPIIRQNFSLGDTIKVGLLSCNKSYFDYFSDIANAEGRGFSAPTPYNPVGNIDNNALGYFGIWYVSEIEEVVQ